MANPIRHRTRPVAPPPPADDPVSPPAIEQSEQIDHPSEHRQDPAAYEVGYGKPPAHSRFKPGVSGNPRGRPKNSRSISALVERELDQRVTVRENGEQIRIRKRDLMAKQLVKKAAEGDPRALDRVLRIEADRLQASQTGSHATHGNVMFEPERDQEILEQYRSLFEGDEITVDDGNEASTS